MLVEDGKGGRLGWVTRAKEPCPALADPALFCPQDRRRGPALLSVVRVAMVRNVDDLDFHVPSHAQDMLDGLRRLRSQPKLADVTLLVGGRELPCHRGLLALSSPYFHAMFAGDFAESFSARVELRDVEPGVVGQLVDFVYTGRLTVTQGNVEALTRTAARLHFPAVQKVCGRYLQQQLDATNCLGICEFGEQQGLLGVAAKAWAFLRENFEAVAREDEFLQLPQDRLVACLTGELLQVQPEQSRLEALLHWVRHDPQARAVHLPELLGLVRLDAVPRPCVQQLLATEPLIRESEVCRVALLQGHDEVSKGQGGEPRRPRPAWGWGVQGACSPVPQILQLSLPWAGYL